MSGNIIPLDKKRFGRNNAMTFEETLYDVTTKMDERAFYLMNYTCLDKKSEPLEEIVRLTNITVTSDGMAALEVEADGRRKRVVMNSKPEYFDGCADKIVYISGLKSVDKVKNEEKWYICSCSDVTDMEESLVKTDKIPKEEKVKFQRSVEKFTPEIQKDLGNKKLALADKNTEEEKKSEVTIYKEQEELDALYNVLKKVMPPEFRNVYETIRCRLDKNCSSSEKRNYLKQMGDILDIDWVRDADYKYIDIDTLRKKIEKEHIGHRKQLEEIYTEFEAANISGIAPKTICLIGHPDVGLNHLAEVIAGSIGRGHTVINLAGIQMKETDSLTGTSKIYDNARAGLVYEHIKEAGLRGVFVIEDFELYESGIRNTLLPIIEKTSFVDKFVEVEIGLANMFVIVTCSDIKDIPMSLRANMTTIYFQDAEESEIIETINKIIVPKYCREYGIDFPKKIPAKSCRILIYKLANMDMNKLDNVIRTIVVNTVTKGETAFPDFSVQKIDNYYYTEEDYKKLHDTYVRNITGAEHKFFVCYDEYEECVQKKAIKLFEILNWGNDESQKEYARDVVHYLANIFKGDTAPLAIGSIVDELNKTHYLQNDLGERIETAVLSKKLEKNTGRMTVIGLKGRAGTGKTSTAKAIARATGRNCIKINVGGAGGGEIIKGTNKTVRNAGPSMIIRELEKSGHGSYSDVIILDEVDKATPDFFNALYEFLDPNEEYIYDQYLECQIPKNNFIVLLTFNDITCIPSPIIDRMEVVEYSNYSIQDKKIIITDYILPKLREKFSIGELSITSDALELYVNQYDVLPGMRDAERDLEYILMRIARNNNGEFDDCVVISKELLRESLGQERTVGMNDVPPLAVGKCGLAQALAVTTSGIGVCTAVETVVNPYQDKKVVVTGLLEGSCLESVTLACCYAGRYMEKELPKLHIHMTDAVKKDGPSAGLTITMSILSCLLERQIPDGIAFTGVIDLYGNIGPVGGTFEKCIAAERSLIKKVIVPSECYKSLVDRNELCRLGVELVPVDTIEDVTKYVWSEEVQR